jgi:hypothetical protein
MIKFFRHIRRSLINQNQMGRYLKYAIGEIILVMIGILLALQVNNWNTNRLNIKLEKNTLNNLRSDLIIQTDIIQNQINKENFFMSYVDTCLNMTHSKIDASRLSRLLDTLSVRLTFVSNKVTFDNIGASGKTTIISNPDLNKEIVDYYQFLDYTESVVNNNNLFRVNSQFGAYVLDNKLGIKIRDDGKIYLQNDLSPEQKYELIKQLEARGYSAENSLNKCTLLLDRTKVLIHMIDQELPMHD